MSRRDNDRYIKAVFVIQEKGRGEEDVKGLDGKITWTMRWKPWA